MSRNDARGQAAAEMVLVLPLLLLLGAGLFQTALLLVQSIRFEHACGTAFRRFAAGEFGEDRLADAVWEALGDSRESFEKGSLRVTDAPETGSGEGETARKDVLSEVSSHSEISKCVLGYGAFHKRLEATYRSRPLFLLLFPGGIRFSTECFVDRYPGGGS